MNSLDPTESRPPRSASTARLQDRLKANWRLSLAGAAITALLGVASWLLPVPGRWLADWSYDLPFAIRGDVAVEEVVIVSMDEASYSELGQNPLGLWDRDLHVELLQRLTALGARAVVFDVLFASPWPDPAVDQRLASAIREHGGVVLAASHQYSERTGIVGASQLVQAVEPIGSSAPWGVVQLLLGADQVVRQHYNEPLYTNLAWSAAALLKLAPPDRVQSRWINYHGSRFPGRQVSYYQVLGTNLLDRSLFKDRVVYVGQGQLTLPARGGDEVRTPYTRWTGHQATGVEVQATVFLNLIRGDWLIRLTPGMELLALLFGGAVVGFGLCLFRPLPALGIAVGCVLAVVGSALGVVWTANVWFPWLIVAGVQIPVAMSWAVLVQAGRGARSELIPDHALLRCVGKGSYGDVWLARNIVGVYHAVKLVYRDRFRDARPFEREFQGIKHFMPISRSLPGWVQIHHVGRNEEEGFFFYIMEAGDDEVTGAQISPDTYEPKTLAGELARRGALPVQECLDLGMELASAMDHLHRKRLIHRDIKPSNIVYVGGAAKFADIGLVTEMRQEGEASTYLGTQGYIAPEGPGSAQADIYGLGKVIYQAATGMGCHLFPELPTVQLESAPGSGFLELFEIIAKACANETTRRHETAAELHAALAELSARLANQPRI